MSTRVIDATVYIGSDDTTYTSTSTSPYALTAWGDTLQIVTPWASPSGSATGNVGEIRWGSQTVLGITTHYIYVCVAANTWKRGAVAAF
jgi:hypothetical protein